MASIWELLVAGSDACRPVTNASSEAVWNEFTTVFGIVPDDVGDSNLDSGPERSDLDLSPPPIQYVYPVSMQCHSYSGSTSMARTTTSSRTAGGLAGREHFNYRTQIHNKGYCHGLSSSHIYYDFYGNRPGTIHSLFSGNVLKYNSSQKHGGAAADLCAGRGSACFSSGLKFMFDDT